jgi:hypothetical protein
MRRKALEIEAMRQSTNSPMPASTPTQPAKSTSTQPGTNLQESEEAQPVAKLILSQPKSIKKSVEESQSQSVVAEEPTLQEAREIVLEKNETRSVGKRRRERKKRLNASFKQEAAGRPSKQRKTGKGNKGSEVKDLKRQNQKLQQKVKQQGVIIQQARRKGKGRGKGKGKGKGK